ncbi:MAG: hypothetical protein QM586_00595 [Xenophilus sp.]
MADAGKTAPKGLNADQFEAVCETIAGRAETLHQLIMLSNSTCHDDFVRGVCADAADALVLAIGAMADGAIGGGIIGGANRWFYGPSFADLGKEVSHG